MTIRQIVMKYCFALCWWATYVSFPYLVGRNSSEKAKAVFVNFKQCEHKVFYIH